MRKLLFSITSVLLCAILLSVNLFAYDNDIEATTIAQNMTEQTVLFIAEAYILADQANRAYENVLTAIKRRDELET